MNGAVREREKREVNYGPRTRKQWATERASVTGLYPAALPERALVYISCSAMFL